MEKMKMLSLLDNEEVLGFLIIFIGVQLSQLSNLARESNITNLIIEADRLHTMFLAMDDAKAVLIKLADRLHNIMTLDALPVTK